MKRNWILRWFRDLFPSQSKEEEEVAGLISYGLVKQQKQPLEVFYKKGVLKNFAKVPGKHLFQSFSFNKVAHLRPATLLKKRFWHKCFPVNFAKFSRRPFLQNTSGWQLLLFSFPWLLLLLILQFQKNVWFMIACRLLVSFLLPLFLINKGNWVHPVAGNESLWVIT